MIGKVGKSFRIRYVARNRQTGLTDVRMVVYKPDGVKQGVYSLTEVNLGDARGVYEYDYFDSDIEGVYMFVINSASYPLKDEKSVYFELDEDVSRPVVKFTI